MKYKKHLTVFVLFAIAAFSPLLVAVRAGSPNTFVQVYDGSTLMDGRLTTGDFDNNGTVDIAIAGHRIPSSTDYSLSVLINDGQGVFTSLSDSPFHRTLALRAGDFDSDHVLDLAVLSNDSGPAEVRVFRGLGDGTFVAVPNAQMVTYARTIDTGDSNGDGLLDVVATGYTGRPARDTVVYPLVSNGDGTLTPHPEMRKHGRLRSAAVVDFDQDGRADVAVLQNWSVQLFRAQPDGSIASPTAIPLDAKIVSPGYFNLKAADFNGDGFGDILFPQLGRSSLGMLRSDSDGSFAPLAFLPGYSNIAYDFAVGDFDGDGLADALINGPGEGMYYRGGAGGLGEASAFTFEGRIQDPMVVDDFDGDGRQDIASSETFSAGARLWVVLSRFSTPAN